MKRTFLTLIATAVWACAPLAALAQSPLKLYTLAELSGTGATSGTNFKNGVQLAVKEINASGGILGAKIELTTLDTQTNPGVAKGLAQRAVDDGAFAVFGPVFSGSIMVSMAETRRAGVPNFTGGEAASITEQGNPYIFRTSFTQATAMPKIARHMAQAMDVKKVAVVYVNNDLGKGGRDAIVKSLQTHKVAVATEVSTDAGQIDFSAPILKVKQSDADAVFVYLNEEESARALRELRKQGWRKPVVGETTLVGQKVIELAGEAANGALAHVGLTVDAPNPNVRAFRAKYEKEFNAVSDHNGIKGYTGVYVLKAAIEKVGKLDRTAVANAMKGLSIKAATVPGVLMDVSYDGKGDLDRESYIVEVQGGKQVVKDTVKALGKAE